MANKLYRAVEAAITFRDSGGDVVITLQNLAATTGGRVSAQKDRGAGSVAMMHEVIGIFQFETAPAVGETVDLYLYQSDGTYVDGTVGTADAALTADKLRNGFFIGSVVVDTTSTGTDVIGRFMNVPITSRYYSVGVANKVADNLKNTANASRIIVTPMPPEIQ